MSRLQKKVAAKVESKKVAVVNDLPDGVTEKQLLALSVEMNAVMDLEPALNEEEVDLEQIKTEAGEIRPDDFKEGRTNDEGEDLPFFSAKATATLKALGIAVPTDEPKSAKPAPSTKVAKPEAKAAKVEKSAPVKAEKAEKAAKSSAGTKTEKLVDIAKACVGKPHGEWLKRFKAYYAKEAARSQTDEHIEERIRSYVAVLGNGK